MIVDSIIGMENRDKLVFKVYQETIWPISKPAYELWQDRNLGLLG